MVTFWVLLKSSKLPTRLALMGCLVQIETGCKETVGGCWVREGGKGKWVPCSIRHLGHHGRSRWITLATTHYHHHSLPPSSSRLDAPQLFSSCRLTCHDTLFGDDLFCISLDHRQCCQITNWIPLLDQTCWFEICRGVEKYDPTYDLRSNKDFNQVMFRLPRRFHFSVNLRFFQGWSILFSQLLTSKCEEIVKCACVSELYNMPSANWPACHPNRGKWDHLDGQLQLVNIQAYKLYSLSIVLVRWLTTDIVQ